MRCAGDGEQPVGAGGIEQRILGDRARRHEARHLAPHHRFAAAFAGVRRVLDLFADGDAMAEADQPVEIILRALDRHAAHRNIVAQMFAALGQHDAERLGGDLGVREEQFVEIAHPVKEQRAGIGRLDLAILSDHRRDFGAAAGIGVARKRATLFRGISGVRAQGRIGVDHQGTLAKPAPMRTARAGYFQRILTFSEDRTLYRSEPEGSDSGAIWTGTRLTMTRQVRFDSRQNSRIACVFLAKRALILRQFRTFPGLPSALPTSAICSGSIASDDDHS